MAAGYWAENHALLIIHVYIDLQNYVVQSEESRLRKQSTSLL